MPGVRVEVTCDECGKPTRQMTGTFAAMRTKGRVVRCPECRLRDSREWSRTYHRTLNASLRERMRT